MKTHGMSFGADGKRTPLHRLWLNVRNRCNNPRTNDYKYYGGRGIRMCARWDNFTLFAADVGAHPGPSWTLDRIETDGHYEPGNVRWATRLTQSQNRKYCKLNADSAADIRRLYIGGARQIDLAAKYNVSQTSISKVVRGDTWP